MQGDKDDFFSKIFRKILPPNKKNLRAASCTRLALYIQPICFYLPFLIDVCYTRNLINADQPSLMCQTKCLSLQSLLCWYYCYHFVKAFYFILGERAARARLIFPS